MRDAEPGPASAPGPILVVDDNEDVRDMLAQALAMEGYQVDTARDGADALSRMRREPPPRLVLLDLYMPKLDGFGVRKEQLKDPRLTAIPVVVYSGHHDVRQAARVMGVDGYFQKPFDVDEILALVNERCGREGEPRRRPRPVRDW
ncbi:MAG: response regulator [Thermodesulfobacteriota bacterium]